MFIDTGTNKIFERFIFLRQRVYMRGKFLLRKGLGQI